MESRVIHRLYGSVPERHPGRVRDRREASPARMPLTAAGRRGKTDRTRFLPEPGGRHFPQAAGAKAANRPGDGVSKAGGGAGNPDEPHPVQQPARSRHSRKSCRTPPKTEPHGADGQPSTGREAPRSPANRSNSPLRRGVSKPSRAAKDQGNRSETMQIRWKRINSNKEGPLT